MELVLAFLAERFAGSSATVVMDLYILGGWVVLASLVFFSIDYFWVDIKQGRCQKQWQWVLLAIDIPPENIQTPRGVEQMFAHVAGAFDPPSIPDKYWHGHKQRWFSFEVVSINGYIQFLIRTEEAMRDLIEAAVYAQYPDAEVTEVEDYATSAPLSYPNETHDAWAGDFGLAANSAFPLRTYEEFRETIGKDIPMSDPMASFLESFSRIGHGEQMWFQILLQPISNSWKEKVIHEVDKMIGQKEKSKNTIFDFILRMPIQFLEILGDQIFLREASTGKKDEKKEPPNQLQYLTPGQSKIVEGMERKMSKVAFKTKIRAVYAAEKAVFRPSRGINALIGAINQFNVPSANALAPERTTSHNSRRVSNRKKGLLLTAYKKRKMNAGGNPFILNIEELATIWHFPMSHVRTPLLQKAVIRQAEPPVGLPSEILTIEEIAEEANKKTGVPREGSQSRYQTDSGESIGFDDDMG